MKTQEIHIIGKWFNNSDRRAIFRFINNEWKVEIENQIPGFYANALSKEMLKDTIEQTKRRIQYEEMTLRHREKALQILEEIKNS